MVTWAAGVPLLERLDDSNTLPRELLDAFVASADVLSGYEQQRDFTRVGLTRPTGGSEAPSFETRTDQGSP
jgi:hypothetical protein